MKKLNKNKLKMKKKEIVGTGNFFSDSVTLVINFKEVSQTPRESFEIFFIKLNQIDFEKTVYYLET